MTALDTVRAWCAGFQGRPLPDGAGPDLVRAWRLGRARGEPS